MAKSAHSVVTAAAATVLLLATAVLVARAGDDTPTTSVLGRQVARETTTSTAAPAEATTTTTALLDVVSGIAVEVTTTTAAPGTTTSAVGRTTTTTAGTANGQTIERADVTSAFDYRANGTGSMTTADGSSPRDPFQFKALGSDVDHDGVAELRSEMANQTNREIAFPDGLVLRFVITRDGAKWRTVELRFPDTRGLPPGGSLEVETATPLQQQYGHYEVTGEVPVDYR
jgi:hypothetical protein